MKKVLLTATMLGLLSSCSILSANAIAIEKVPERGSISVSTTANTEIAPDVAEIAFSVVTSDEKSMQKATVQNKVISDKLYSLLSGMLAIENGDFIKTSDFNATPIYSAKNKIDKYEVSNRVIVHTKSLEKVGLMIDKAIASGATNVDSLAFSVSNYDSKCDSLLEIATKKAKNRAGLLAKSLDSQIDGVKSFNVSCNANNYHNNRMYMAKNTLSSIVQDSSSGEASTTINSGVVKIYANVNASFFVK